MHQKETLQIDLQKLKTLGFSIHKSQLLQRNKLLHLDVPFDSKRDSVACLRPHQFVDFDIRYVRDIKHGRNGWDGMTNVMQNDASLSGKI